MEDKNFVRGRVKRLDHAEILGIELNVCASQSGPWIGLMQLMICGEKIG